jgi:hypothetical protein
MEQVTDEEWRAIPGYEGLYEVSDQGRVRSLDRDWGPDSRGRRRPRRGKMLRPSTASGYPVVVLAGRSTRSVHSLVAEAFLGPRPSGLVVRHLNGDYLDPRAENLAYSTRKENAADMYLHGTSLAFRTRCRKRGHEFTPENTVYLTSTDGQTQRLCRACRRIYDREKGAAT